MPPEPSVAQTLDPSLDSADYNPIVHLNTIFSHPSALLKVTAASDAIQSHRDDLDVHIEELVEAQAKSNIDSVDRIQSAKIELGDLFRKIEDVRSRATQTERAITDMTADIKRLDATKRNLTLSMTALKRLQMLTTAYGQLWALGKSRDYRECAQLLQAVIQLMAYFRSYRSIDQIATLSRNVADLQRELQEQICEDFEITFAKGEVHQRRTTLAEACLVIDALGDNARSRLVIWYCNTQLREYRQLFRGNEEAGSLDNISRRYAWFKRMLKVYDDENSPIFPITWKVNEVLANSFCEGTRDDFKGILARSMRRLDGQTIDVDLLLSCLQQTLEFEQYLEQKLSSDSRASLDTLSSKEDKGLNFGRAISEAFEPYLSLWVESQDRNLSGMITKCRQQPLRAADEDFSAQSVAPSSIEMFQSYRAMLAQCAKLSTRSRLLELSKVFARHLDAYAEQVLLARFSPTAAGRDMPLEDVIVILNTADYCHLTCGQLEEKVRGRLDEELKGKVDLHSQQDAFMGVASAAIRALVRRVDQAGELAWREMRNVPWGKLDAVGDQSPFVGELLSRVKARASEVLLFLSKQQYARAFCDNVVELLANTYLANILLCKPISETGAEQMLLDLYVLKKGFQELPTLTSKAGTMPPASYVKRVNQSMQKLDPLLKTLQVQSVPPEGLVQAYLIHIGDRSDSNFKKILELKGVRRQDQPQLIELFQAHRASPNSNSSLVQHSTLLTPLNLAATSSSTSTSNVLASLGTATALSTPSLQARFDPATLGSAIMSVARDGVDRFGSPSMPSSGFVPSGAQPFAASNAYAPPSAAGLGVDPSTTIADTASTTANNLQENLRNIGRFFRRDIGAGFSGRFTASRTNSEDASL